jgi:hypothetical protein
MPIPLTPLVGTEKILPMRKEEMLAMREEKVLPMGNSFTVHR